MEECCAVCAEPLEWAAYGPCGHREVCSTCIARLRFVLDDKRCCICKQECPSVFVTKALGDYTKVIGDFEQLANRAISGKGDGDMWYESNTQAYFDDEEQFKMVKAMCRLYCSVCEKAEDPGVESVKKGYIFRNLDLLRRHLIHAHKVQMCELCLEGRKVFICEQKLYPRAQLDRHASKGDSLVDGNEEERGGFTGHPMCDFCKRRYYGENELYQHMSTEHYTCHICQRLRPGRYDYYRNYDDLEAHFRHEHVLCEHPECLARKFVVFTSEAELKRHNAVTHGGHMSRAQRNAALQIPLSFQYRRPGQDHGDASSRRGGHGRGLHFIEQGRGTHSNEHLSAVMRASIDSANLEHALRESTATTSEISTTSSGSSTNGRDLFESSDPAASRNHDNESGSSSSFTSFITEPSRYRTAVSCSSPSSLEDSAFPPLPGSNQHRRKSKQNIRRPAMAMTSLFGSGQGGIRVLNSSDFRQIRDPGQRPSKSISTESIPANHSENNLVSVNPIENSSTNRQPVSAVSGPGPPSVAGPVPSGGESTVPMPVVEDYNKGNTNATQLSMEEIRNANKVLVERIRGGLNSDELQFMKFKDISSEFRRGDINARAYYKHIKDFGLSHLVPELARLCPDPSKQKDLLVAHQEGQHSKPPDATVQPQVTIQSGGVRNGFTAESSKDLASGKSLASSSASATADLDRGVFSSNGEVEILSKDGYRDSIGKMKVMKSSSSKSSSLVNTGSPSDSIGTWQKPAKVLVKAKTASRSSSPTEPVDSMRPGGMWACSLCTLDNKASSSQCAACGMSCPCEKAEKMGLTRGSEKRKKKTSKFDRNRLVGDAEASLLDLKEDHLGVDSLGNAAVTSNSLSREGQSSSGGAWRNGGGQRLLSLVAKGGNR